ncbi:MAG: hypothetical protein AB1657_03130 [Candidatus Micrarchaeota archaeon]
MANPKHIPARAADGIGSHPRARWGLFRDGSSAKKLEAEGRLFEAGIAYVECGKHSNALRMVRAILADGFQSPVSGSESSCLRAARIIIALWKSTGDDGWRLCAERLGRKAQEEGNLEDAALIFEEAGFGHAAALARKNLRLSTWSDSIGK